MRLSLLVALLSGCTFAHRAGKLAAPDAYLLPVPDQPAEADVRYVSGLGDDPERPWDPEPFGGQWLRPVPITTSGAVLVTPPAGAAVEVWIRSPGLDDQGFVPVLGRTGALHRSIPNELRLGWGEAGQPQRIEVAHLASPYAGARIGDGDLLLVRVDGPDTTPEDYLFRCRKFGLRTRAGAGVLFRIPVPGVEGQRAEEVSTSTTLALSLAWGVRPRTRSPVVYWLTEQLALATSVGVGSTTFADLQADGDAVDTQLQGAFNALLVGGGVEVFRFVSLQAQVNGSSFLRDGAETPWALAVGFDAVQFALFTRDAGARLFQRNELDP